MKKKIMQNAIFAIIFGTSFGQWFDVDPFANSAFQDSGKSGPVRYSFVTSNIPSYANPGEVLMQVCFFHQILSQNRFESIYSVHIFVSAMTVPTYGLRQVVFLLFPLVGFQILQQLCIYLAHFCLKMSIQSQF